MAKISLSPKFIKDSFIIIKNKGLKSIIFGNKVTLDKKGIALLDWIKKNPDEFSQNGRKGDFIKISIIHKGMGEVYLFNDRKDDNQSILLFNNNVKIRSEPDLYVYLSTNSDVRKGLGKILNLGLLKGSSGGQVYIINENIKSLEKYKSVVIYCKQFEELFTFARLKR